MKIYNLSTERTLINCNIHPRLAAIGAMLTILATSPVPAALLKAADFDHIYHGDVYNGSNPKLTGSDGSKPFSATEFPGASGTFNPSVVTGLPVAAPGSPYDTHDGNVFQFQNTIADAGSYFVVPDAVLADGTAWTIEARLKIGTDAPHDPDFGAVTIVMKRTSTGSSSSNTRNRRIILGIGNNFVVLWSFADGTGPHTYITGDNTDGYHDFRITQAQSANTVNFWRDGALLYTGVPDDGGGSGTGQMYFGDGSGSAGGPTISVDYFAWTTGAHEYEPSVVPEPHSFALALLGAFGLFWNLAPTTPAWFGSLRSSLTMRPHVWNAQAPCSRSKI
jgi:hypothetical protein